MNGWKLDRSRCYLILQGVIMGGSDKPLVDDAPASLVNLPMGLVHLVNYHLAEAGLQPLSDGGVLVASMRALPE